MIELVHIPEADEQTDTRNVVGFWMSGLLRPKLIKEGNKCNTQVPAVWLVRNAVNSKWRGIELRAETGENPISKTAYACKRILGVMPDALDIIEVMQPDRALGIKRTTFLVGMAGSELPRPIVSVEAGLFPLSNLPLDPQSATAEHLAATLNRAYGQGLSAMHATVVNRGAA